MQKPMHAWNIHRAYRLSKAGLMVAPHNVMEMVKEIRTTDGDQTLMEHEMKEAERTAECGWKVDPGMILRFIARLHAIRGTSPADDRYAD